MSNSARDSRSFLKAWKDFGHPQAWSCRRIPMLGNSSRRQPYMSRFPSGQGGSIPHTGDTAPRCQTLFFVLRSAGTKMPRKIWYWFLQYTVRARHIYTAAGEVLVYRHIQTVRYKCRESPRSRSFAGVWIFVWIPLNYSVSQEGADYPTIAVILSTDVDEIKFAGNCIITTATTHAYIRTK